SPLADYNNLGTTAVETVDTYPEGGQGLSRGRVYAFYRQAPTQSVILAADFALTAGKFTLQMNHNDNIAAVSDPISHASTAEEFKAGVESLGNVGQVEVSVSDYRTASATFRRWDVTFVGSTASALPALVYGGTGCVGCQAFSSAYSGGDQVDIAITRSDNGPWSFHHSFQATDGSGGDRFGLSIAMDGATALVGAHYSSALATTTWDFETGDLVGWEVKGGAFNNQPTLGDNSYVRVSLWDVTRKIPPPLHTQRAVISNLKGRYYVGTFEDHPGAGDTAAHSFASPPLPCPMLLLTSERVQIVGPGGAQGDGPTGEMLSQAFMVMGDEVSFLVGGGCDLRFEYVELLVDGVSVAKAGGNCDEGMRRVKWDVTHFRYRAAQFHVVDASSDEWGHISVDDFLFSWDNRGGQMRDRTGSSTSQAHYSLKEETARAGAAYVFALKQNDAGGEDTREFCRSGQDRASRCVWREDAKLVSSSKREGDMFGSSLGVDHDSGVAAVGASGASLTGFWGEAPSVYRSNNPHGHARLANATAITLPKKGRHARKLSQQGAFGLPGQSGSAAPFVWEMSQEDRHFADEAEAISFGQLNSYTGAVHIFKRTEEVRGPFGPQIAPNSEARWPSSEHFKLHAHDAMPGDRFGASVALQQGGRQLFVGAPYSDAFEERAGAVYQFDIGVVRVAFTKREYAVEEGDWGQKHQRATPHDDWRVGIELVRDLKYSNEYLTVGFATSDVTARGVDSPAFQNCFGLPAAERGNHWFTHSLTHTHTHSLTHALGGDYEQTAGQVTFEPGQVGAAFHVRIMDDLCRELFPEYVQLTLSIPGTSALYGDAYSAKIRIDDDDWER
ncbi:unnamed protein product, partial [Chrysoparadoxa australica]